MEIKELELFDLYGDGTLVMKTNVDVPNDSLRFCWYIKEKGRLIYRGNYQRNSFSAFQLPHLGKYMIKAFVRDEQGEKAEIEVEFNVTKKTSPQLVLAESTVTFSVQPKVEHISGGFWCFQVEGEIPEDARFAWYVYKEDIDEPVVRTVYSEESNYTYKFDISGTYYVKLFVLANGKKKSIVTEQFKVIV